jgi:hypothetical protein
VSLNGEDTLGFVDDDGLEHFVVKVQVSLRGNPATLVYNKDKTIIFDDCRELGERLLGDEIKGYFWAHMEGTIIYIDGPVPDQSW